MMKTRGKQDVELWSVSTKIFQLLATLIIVLCNNREYVIIAVINTIDIVIVNFLNIMISIKFGKIY